MITPGLSILDEVEQAFAPTDVGIHQFAESSDFCDKYLYPGQIVFLKLIFLEEMTGPEEDILTHWMNGGRNGTECLISPNIRERRDFLRENGYKHFREVQLAGGRRSSKGFMLGIAMAYVMYQTLLLGDPGGYYGIDRKRNIEFSCVAGSETQAKDYQYADFVSTIETCKPFQPYLVKSLETEFRVATPADLKESDAAKARGNKAILRDQARLRGKALAANASTLRGSATMVITIDEAAHMMPGESKASADQVYVAAEPSLDQFGLDGMMFLASSPYTKVGMFYEAFEHNMRPFDPNKPLDFTPVIGDVDEEVVVTNGDPRNFCIQYPSWLFYEGYRYFKTKYKQRERGREFGKMIQVSPDWNPEEEDAEGRPKYSIQDKGAILQARAREAANPEAYKVERRGKFAEVSDAFLNPMMVDQMYKGVPDGFEEMPNGDVIRRFKPLFSNYGLGVATNLHRYKFHVDPSSTTAGFGFAIGHIEYFPDPVTGQDMEHVVFDLIKAWHPDAFGGVIKWAPILQEIATYAEIFRPFEITFDQHQSSDPIQDLQERLNAKNIQCRVSEKFATNELNWKRWEVFKTALYQGLVHAPCDETPTPATFGSTQITSKDELKFLQQIVGGGKYPKIEKQDIGPVQVKDRADCLAEVVYTLIGNLHLTHMRERLASSAIYGGSPGGYGIGQGGYPTGGKGPPGISEYYSRRDEKMSQYGITKSSLTRGALGGVRQQRARRTRGRF
jgi:hypothetical protein